MRLLHRPLRAGGAAVLGLATIALTGAFAASGAHLRMKKRYGLTTAYSVWDIK